MPATICCVSPSPFCRHDFDHLERTCEFVCLGFQQKNRPGKTFTYFPALVACCETLEYLVALHRGNTNGIGWQQVDRWVLNHLPQPDYSRDTVRVHIDAFCHSIAHRGIATGIWIDRNQGTGHGRRVTWKVMANAHPASVVSIQSRQISAGRYPNAGVLSALAQDGVRALASN